MHNVAHRTANVCQNQQCTGIFRALLTGFQWVRGIRSRQIALGRVIQRDPNDLVSRGPWDKKGGYQRKGVLRRLGEGALIC